MDKIVDKLMSGRFLFTIVTAIVFFNLAVNDKLPVDRVVEIIILVFYAYFNKPSAGSGTTNGGIK